jgi:hypothetical protein
MMDLEKKLKLALSSREKMIQAKAPKTILDLCDHEVFLLKQAIAEKKDYLWVTKQLSKYEREYEREYWKARESQYEK